MREDHVLHGRDGHPVPTAEELELSIAAARRLRSRAVHAYFVRAVAWVRRFARPAPAPRHPVGQCC